jgi:hypothetical protein
LAILHLSRLDGKQDPAEAWSEHLAALLLVRSQTERQASLCTKFSNSMPQATPTALGTIDLASTESFESELREAGCTCPLATMLPTRTEGHTLRR